MDQAVNTNAGGVCGNQTLIVLDKIEKWCSWVGHSPTTSQTVKHRVSCHQTIPLLGNDPRERKAFVNTKSCTCMFTVDLFTKAPEWKPPTCPWGENWINEPRNICQWNINQPPRGPGSHSHCNVNETWKYDAEWKSTSCKMSGWMNHKLESRLPAEQHSEICRWKWKWKALSCVRLFATSCTLQSMEFSRPESWSG